MTLTILGSSSALPTSERYPSAHVLKAHERLFLIDCGEGTQMQFRRNRIRFGRLNHIFISHLHGDHVFGLYGRTALLHLYAPKNYINILYSHLNDFDIRLGFEIDFVPLSGNDPVEILDDKYISVTSFPLQHRIPAFGFLFREKPALRKIIREKIEEYQIPTVRIPAIKNGEDFVLPSGEIIPNSRLTIDPPAPLSYAYCSDTKYFPELASFIKGVTVLYHEATFDKTKQDLAITTGHSTTYDAARTALEAGAGSLIIGHFSARYRDVTMLLEESREIFPGSYAAVDGRTYDISGFAKPL